MTTQHATVEQPYSIGRIRGGWIFLIVILLVLAGVGLIAYSYQLAQGEIVTGLRSLGTMAGVTWGQYVVFYIYFMGLSFAGISLAVGVRLLNLEPLQPISRMAQVLTVTSIIVAALAVLADLGQPGRALINLLRYARPGSPFFGTFALVVSGYFFASVVYLYLDARRCAALMVQNPGRLQGFYRLWAAGYKDTEAERQRHEKATFWLAIGILPLLLVATSTLGFVFGLQSSRPGWFSALQGPGFVILASLSGVGMLVIIAAILRKALDLQDYLKMETFRWLGNILMVLTGVYLYFMVVEWLSAAYSAHVNEVQLAQALISGDYALLFWGTVALLVIVFALLLQQYLRKEYRLAVVVTSGVLVNLAALGKRYLIVIPSQTHGTLLPYGVGLYNPTWVEYAIVVGLFALGALLFALFVKLFPIVEMPETATLPGPATDQEDNSRRSTWAIIMVVLGFALQGISYVVLAAPLGIPTSEFYSNPRVPFAPLIFVIGVALVFLAAVVYELLPDQTADEPQVA
jgi:molybdopterin-containing oxidoreductase family membrane subunit